MTPARSRRVQAQRKFAQGAYVPPNVVAVVAADNRRDAAQDPRNVTINNMTATGLLDVVSLQSHSHLTSQPVVIVERLCGRIPARDVLPPSQSETVEPRLWEYPHERVNNNVATIKKPAEPPKLQTVKKKKQYKREHPMLLRCRRHSRLELNKLIVESCAPLRKVSVKRRKNSSDEDEPLIFQITRLKQTAKQLSTPKQTAARESAPMENTPKPNPPKENTPKPSPPKEDTPKSNPPKENTSKTNPRKENTPKPNTPKENTPKPNPPKENTPKPNPPKEKSPKQKPCKKRTKNEITTNEISLKDRRNVKQSIACKKTSMKRVAPKRIHKKCSPKQPMHVAPEFSVPEYPIPDFLITVVTEDSRDETVAQDDKEDMVTPDNSVITGVPNDPVTLEVLDDLVAPGVPVATDDPVVPPVPVPQDVSNVPMVLDNEEEWSESVPSTAGLTEVLVVLDQVCANERIGVWEDNESVISHDEPMVKNDVPEVPDDVPTILLDVPIVNNDPMVNDDLMVNDDVPEVPVDVMLILHKVPMASDDGLEDTDDPNVPLVKRSLIIEDDVMVQEDMMDPPTTKLRIASQVYNSGPQEYATIDDSDHLIYESDEDESFLEEANLERARNVMFEVPTICVAAEWRSDQDVINASQELLDSRCKACKPCIRIEKLMKVSTLLKSQIELIVNAAVLENEPTEREGETEDVEIDNENPDSTNDDQSHLYLLLPKHSCVMLKLRTSMVHGKEVLGVCLMPRNESLKNKQAFSLEKQEHLLDQLIKTLTNGQDVDSMGRNKITEGRNINTGGQNDNTEDRNDNTEDRNDNTEDRNDNTEDRKDNIEGRKNNTEGRKNNTVDRNDNTEGRSDNLKGKNDISLSRSISISSDSTTEMSDASIRDQETINHLTADKRKLNKLAVKKKLAEAKLMHDRIREEKKREIARLEEEKRQEISRITAEKNIVVAQMSRYHERVTQMEKQKERDFARLKVEIRAEVISKMEAKRRMYAEVDGMAANLAKEKDAKKMDPDEFSDYDAPGTSSSLLTTDGGLLVDAPVYHPDEEDFRDILRYYEKIWPEAVRYGICKVVPPPGWKPPFRVHDEMRFDVTNQYISRLFNRWGPAARELCAIKLSLAQQKVNFTRAPLLDGVEVNLPKLYHLVQRHGGLETVYNKKRWGKVAEDMKFNKGPNTERKLDQIYVKYLLPYDTLSHQERQDIMRKVEIAWNRKNQKLLDRAVNPLNRQKRLLGLMDSSDDETEDEDTVAAVNEAEDCIIKGAVMNRAKFKKIATMTYENTFGQGSEAADPPELIKIEEYYWRLVTLGTEHVCVHTAAIDTGEEGYGFIKNKSDSYGRHPWNPKMVSQNPRNVLQYLGPVLGVTVPTLLLGMLFSTSCWHKDPHAVSWLEYQLLGPERIWYGIPAHQADNFRKAVETLCPTSCQNKGLWLPTDITMIPPNLLREHNVTLSRVTQRDCEYILAFPNAYTCCISTGYTESESIYFAPPAWLENLWTVFKEARESCEPTMFAMEHLLYNIGKDPKAEHTILKIAQPLYDKMLREEVTNRQMLQERGLPFVQDLLGDNTSRKKNKGNPFSPRDQDECEYCRATLYLSKVKGLTGRNTVLCLEHALKLLDTEKHKDINVEQLQVLVHVSVKELNTVHDDMKRRLGIPIA